MFKPLIVSAVRDNVAVFSKQWGIFIHELGNIFDYDLNDILMLYLTYIHLEKILFSSIKFCGGVWWGVDFRLRGKPNCTPAAAKKK